MSRLATLLLLPALCLAGEPAAPPAPADASPAAMPAVQAATTAPATGGTVAPASPETAPAWAAKLRADADAVMKSEEFHQVSRARGLAMREWLRRWLTDDDEKKPARPFDFSFAGLALVLKWLVIVALVVTLVWLLWRGWQWLAPRVGQRRREPSFTPLEAERLSLPRDTLPDGVSRAARTAWQQGDAALALSLLYRGAVQALEERYAIELPDSATEGECLRLARRTGKAVVTEGFAPIVRAWIALAYARQSPGDFDGLATLYASHFESASAGGPRA